MDKNSSLLRKSVNYGRKSFIVQTPWDQMKILDLGESITFLQILKMITQNLIITKLGHVANIADILWL